MAYSENILPRSAAYYTFNGASISGSDLIIETNGYAEISVSKQMLPTLTSRMLVVVHPSVFSSSYTNDAVQVTLSVITEDDEHLTFLIPASEQASGVFNTEIDLPEGNYTSFTYRISSAVPVTIYNWELCSEVADDVSTIIEGVEQALPRLLYDFNTYSYAVAQNELTVGLISCYLQQSTDLQGHFTLSFFATERCNVHVRIKDNNVTELYTPQVYTVEKGYASISIPHAYLKKTATDHAFAVTLQCTNGQLSIPVRGLLYTIDGGYLATRLLDAGIDIEDVSIRQLSTDTDPSEIWAIGYEGDRLVLKKRDYSQAQRVDWTAVKDFGEGLHAAVEFNGRWTSRPGSNKHTMETEEIPFVFVVDTSNTLNAYFGSDYSGTLQLDTDVTEVSACQGFNSMYDIEQDQGVVVAYVKNGNVYYRQWIYNSGTDAYMWYPAELLYSNGDASFVSVHRLPDYRLGICVEHTSGTKWFITDRTYVSQAIKTEVISASTKTRVLPTVIDVDKAPETVYWVATTNTFEAGESFSTVYNGFEITFDGTFVFLDDKKIEDLIEIISVKVGNTTVAVESVEISASSILVYVAGGVKGGKTVTISFECDWLLIRIYNNCRAIIQKSYSWTTPLVPVELQPESYEANLTAELTAKVTPIITSTLPMTEDLAVDLTPTLDLSVKEIVTSNVPQKEDFEVSLTSTLTLSVLQTGTSPI